MTLSTNHRTRQGTVLKRLLLGRPMATEEARHQLLPKILALPVFASDALSSVAYATEEIMIVLLLAGLGALRHALPIALAVSAVMTIVIISYRQTVRAYPNGGGAYIVAHENLGELPGLVAAAALLTDYVLTVAVSIAAGAFALASLAPALLSHRVALSLGFIALITIANLRGARESGRLFAIPTYAFIFSILVMVLVGVSRCVGGCPHAAIPPNAIPAEASAITLLLVLRAFASGSTALTGVEAIANGVPAFRGRRPRDQAHNAATTLAFLGVIAITMFVGITFLATHMHARPSEAMSIVAQVAKTSFGGGVGFVAVQITTMLILVLAANTAYQDFPRLSSILAKDRFMPRQFINRGDRLVFSNGIVALATLAALLIWLYDAEVTRLIQLYVLGVFTSFTLSQIGMVVKWRRDRAEGWRRSAALNTVGAIATGIVLVVVAITKFKHGAYIIVAAVPLIVLGFKAINRHYIEVAKQLRLPEGRPRVAAATRAVVLVPRVDAATLRALGYARSVRPRQVIALHFDQGDGSADLQREWDSRQIGIPLDLAPCEAGDLVGAVRRYVRSLPREPDEFITVVVPETIRKRSWLHLLRDRGGLLLKAALLFEPNVVVTDVPTILEAHGEEAPARGAIAPSRVVAVVLVSAVHNAALRALAYARSLSPTDLRAVAFGADPEETERIISDWERAGIDVALEVIDSPYREVREPLLRYVRRLRSAQPDLIVSVIIPEFVVRKRWHQILHNQTALALKAALIFEPGVVVTSVPFHLR